MLYQHLLSGILAPLVVLGASAQNARPESVHAVSPDIGFSMVSTFEEELTPAEISAIELTQERIQRDNDAFPLITRIEEVLFGNRSVEGLFLEPTARVLEPKLRIYFDTGDDGDGEIDVFDDGSVTVSLNLLEIRWTRYVGSPIRGENESLEDWTKAIKADDGLSRWSYGFAAGFGIGVPAQEGATAGAMEASDAPVLLLSAGVFLEYSLVNTDALKALDPIKNRHLMESAPSLGIEFGYAYAISADEGAQDIDDGALYAGLTLHVPF